MAIGANAIIQWIGEDPKPAYISYGEYNEQTNEDGLGVSDDLIFYYANPEELKELTEYEPNRGWTLISYEEESE